MKGRSQNLRNIANLVFFHGNSQCNTTFFHMVILIIAAEIIVTVELQ